jgi:hypothetical protein
MFSHELDVGMKWLLHKGLVAVPPATVFSGPQIPAAPAGTETRRLGLRVRPEELERGLGLGLLLALQIDPAAVTRRSRSPDIPLSMTFMAPPRLRR